MRYYVTTIFIIYYSFMIDRYPCYIFREGSVLNRLNEFAKTTVYVKRTNFRNEFFLLKEWFFNESLKKLNFFTEQTFYLNIPLVRKGKKMMKNEQ